MRWLAPRPVTTTDVANTPATTTIAAAGIVTGEASLLLAGASRSGKSTLALTILRLLPPAARITAGQIRFEGEVCRGDEFTSCGKAGDLRCRKL